MMVNFLFCFVVSFLFFSYYFIKLSFEQIDAEVFHSVKVLSYSLESPDPPDFAFRC